MVERLDYHWEEIRRLREWRHDAGPRLEAMAQLLLDTRARLENLEHQVDKLEDAGEIANAVADALHRSHMSLLTRSEKLLAALLAIPGLVLTTVELVRIIG